MRNCPFQDCAEEISGASFCCKTHWCQMTRHQRDRAFSLYRRYIQRDLTGAELEAERSKLVEEVEFSMTFSMGDCPPIKKTCRCGAVLIAALCKTGGTGFSLLLEPGDVDGGLFVVVNGKAYHGAEAMELRKNAPALARLNPHSCWACKDGREQRSCEAA